MFVCLMWLIIWLIYIVIPGLYRVRTFINTKFYISKMILSFCDVDTSKTQCYPVPDLEGKNGRQGKAIKSKKTFYAF